MGNGISVTSTERRTRKRPKEQRIWLLAQTGDHKGLRRALSRFPSIESIEWPHPVGTWTPLAIASLNGHAECVYRLLGAGADCNRLDARDQTPLHLATRNDHHDIVRMLIHAGADCNAVDTQGFTPLLLAAWLGKSKVLDLLLSTPDVDVFACNTSNGLDALKTARLAYSLADGALEQRRLMSCLKFIELKFLIRRGWLYDGACASSSHCSAGVKRYYMIFRTADPSVMRIDFFANADDDHSSPYLQLTHHESDNASGLSSMEVRGLRFILHAAAASRGQIARTFEFIAPNESEFAFWMGLSVSSGSSRSTNGRSEDPVQQSPVSSLMVLESDALDVFTMGNTDEKATDCVICYDAQQSVVCVPCGHIAMCSSCAHEVVKSTHLCPLCRVPIREIVRFFRA